VATYGAGSIKSRHYRFSSALDDINKSSQLYLPASSPAEPAFESQEKKKNVRSHGR
jgi:hypothetical protein